MFDKYPYSDFHSMNLDWIIKEMKDLIDSWDEFGATVTAEAHAADAPEVTVEGDLKSNLNFNFGLVPGPQGVKGDRGPQGIQGEQGSGLEILDSYATLADLQNAHPTGSPGDAYAVGTGTSRTIYIWSTSSNAWVSVGTISSPSPASTAPLMDGTAAAGTSALYSRADHVHPKDSTKLDLTTEPGVYAVVDDEQVMVQFSDNSSAGSLVEYDAAGNINTSDLNASGTVNANSISVTNNAILNSAKLEAVVAGGNAHQALATVNPIDPLSIGVNDQDDTPTVAFHGVKYDADGNMTSADAAAGFTNSFTYNYVDYTDGRIDLADATNQIKGGVRIGAGLTVSEGTLSNAYVAGDSVSIAAATTSDIIVSGLVSGGSAALWFTIPLDKPILANNVNFTSLKILSRGINGYIDGTGYTDIATDNRYTVTYSVNRFCIKVQATRNTPYDVTNNTPATIIIRGFDCSFS